MATGAAPHQRNEAVEAEIELLLASLGVDAAEAGAAAGGGGEGDEPPVRIVRGRTVCVCLVGEYVT